MSQLRPVDLRDHVALVAGGTGEVGAAFVDLLGSAGAEVAVAAEAGPTLERLAIRTGVEVFESDPADPGGLSAAAEAIAGRLGRLDLLVCVLGSLAADPDATFAALREAARTMAAGGRGGRILVVGPVEALPAMPIRDTATGLAAAGVTVNAVFHGPLRPEEPDDWDGVQDELAAVGTLPAADIPRAALWLLDPEVGGVSGIVLNLDPGPGRRDG